MCYYFTEVNSHHIQDFKEKETTSSQLFLTLPEHSEECMCCLRNIAICDCQKSVTTGQIGLHTDIQTNSGQIFRNQFWQMKTCAECVGKRIDLRP